jgi:ribonuclease HII
MIATNRKHSGSKNSFEHAAWASQGLVCGIDEVGRGCLAGPVITAAVILPINTTNRQLKDSKIMSEDERLKAAAWIYKHCWYGFGIVHHRDVDEHNIWQATLIAMKRALLNALSTCPHEPSAVLVDAMPLTLLDTSYKTIPVHSFIKGESRSSSIAAASIIAKVRRDALMQKFDTLFPGYFLGEHKGYATHKHTASLYERPHSLIHRTSFLTNVLAHKEHHDKSDQQTLF